jgi:hypothetical protein
MAEMTVDCDLMRDLAPGFVLDALDSAEMDAVREHLATCREPHPELRELGGVVSYLGSSLAPEEPSARLKEAVLAAARADLRAPSATLGTVANAPAVAAPIAPAASAEGEPRKVVSIASARSSRIRRVGTWATRIAAGLAIVALVGYAFALQGDLNRAHTAIDNSNKVLNAMANPQARSAVLSQTGSQAAGKAVLLPSGHVLVYLNGLQPTAADAVYMVWLSVDGGATTKAGSLALDDQGKGFVEMDNVPPSSSLWVMVCREPNAGVAKPTGPVIAAGTIYVYDFPSERP